MLSTGAVERGRLLVLDRPDGQGHGSGEQPSQGGQVPGIAGAGQHLQAYRIADSDGPGEQLVD